MDIATGAMNALLSKLGELLVDEYNLQNGVKEEIKKLQKELTYMNAALRKVSEVPVDQLEDLVKIWAGNVRELSYDIEDAVDNFMVSGNKRKRTEPHSFKAWLDKATEFFRECKTNHEIHNVIKGIMCHVMEIKERHDRYNVGSVASRTDTVTVDLRIEAMFRKATELVGIAGPKNELAKRLMKEDGLSRQPQIISIVGFGGLGKTTLAKALFDELKAKFKFECNFFVSVSLNPDIKMIFKRILGELGRKDINEACDLTQLIEKIREHLKDKRCLCVIDDIWEKPAWDIIKLALQDGNCESKIITTTRNKDVAEHAGGVYELQPLSDDYSKELFNMRIFKDGCPPHLTIVTENILNKCGGVPLAIITTASLLANKPTKQEWEKVNESIGTGMEKSLAVDKMSKILSLSYHDLPPHLKTCLLYLSKYPEDMEIRRDTLVSSWIAEGFITDVGQAAGARLQEVGVSYFNELINRSLIQPVEGNSCYEFDQVYCCRVHDMVLDLLNQLSAEEGFVTTLFADGQQVVGTSSVQKNKIRRLSLHNSGNTFASLEARERLSQVRSLTVFGRVDSSADSIPPISSFPALRVLQIEDCHGMQNLRLKNHLQDLGKLRLLRFLRLHGIKEIPESIGNLQFLHTLDVRTQYSGETSLPKSFVNLGQLVRLVGDGVMLPHGVTLGNMKSLQEVIGIYVVTECEMQEIGTLTKLRVLRMYVDDDAKRKGNFKQALLECLQRCNKLQDITIQVYRYATCFPENFMQWVPSGLQRFLSNTAFKEFPEWINSSLSSLTTVSIVVHTCMRQKYLDELAELPSLLIVRLEATGCPERKERIIIHSAGHAFQSLQRLQVVTPWMGLTFQPRAMPKLQRLHFAFFPSPTKDFYGGFDFGLENLPSLSHATFDFGEFDDKLEPEAEAALRRNHPSFELSTPGLTGSFFPRNCLSNF